MTKKIFKLLLIPLMLLVSCNEGENYEKLKQSIFTKVNFDVTKYNEVTELAVTSNGNPFKSIPSFKATFSNETKLYEQFSALLKSADYYTSTLYEKDGGTFFNHYIGLEYTLFSKERILIVHSISDYKEGKTQKRAIYDENGDVVFKDIYQWDMLCEIKKEHTSSRKHYTIDLKTKENSQKFGNLLTGIFAEI